MMHRSSVPAPRALAALAVLLLGLALAACAPVLPTRSAPVRAPAPTTYVPAPAPEPVIVAPAPEARGDAPAAFSPPAPVVVVPPAAEPGASAAVMLPPPLLDSTRGSPQPPRSAPSTPVTRARVALIVPLASATFGGAGEAVAAGFKAAADLASTPVTIIPHGDGEVLSAVDKARQANATVLVGPLLRDDLKTLASSRIPLPWTIALNQLEDNAVLPERVYTLALTVEGEARQIARTMRAEGVREVAIVAGDAPLQRRFGTSFTGEWLLQGGGPPLTFRVLRDADSLAILRRELGRTPIDAVLLATDAVEAALVKPYLPRTRVYASSQVNDRQPIEIRNDLDAIHFVEVALLADPEAPALAGVPRREWGNPTLDRLYALGFDAFQVAIAFERGPPQSLEIEGATGHLSLGRNREIVREGRLTHFDGGQIVADERR